MLFHQISRLRMRYSSLFLYINYAINTSIIMDISSTPYALSNDTAYQTWRNHKLINFTNDINKLVIGVDNITTPTSNEIKALQGLINQYNMGFYRLNNPATEATKNKRNIPQFARFFGLQTLDQNLCSDDDKLTSISVCKQPNQHQYIPYSNKRLSWHTDGYYNTSQQQINSFILHCEHPAKSGGESLLLDPDIAYILLRDENPDYIRAFMQTDAMTIPANILNGKEIRAAQTGPIFSLHSTGALHMRYSARTRNIKWQQNSATLEAVEFLQQLWKTGSPYILRHTLQAHEGLLCNNVLHCRTAFEDSDDLQKKRLLYRGRYFDRVSTR
ncbi:MAG TPA: taurine catabolism dioxygenase TauD [Leucothrix mucor]|uniref:Taurine catabolism dioxygenase TauD n=1 Tax=Leucothrix mucor TaxID=45248 RepID=A0A7V2T1D8_LEUMU|nr:taurine catabolism dioxygenase TauD [Leucothrix mucor]